jgi:hypothetical protein
MVTENRILVQMYLEVSFIKIATGWMSDDSTLFKFLSMQSHFATSETILYSTPALCSERFAG